MHSHSNIPKHIYKHVHKHKHPLTLQNAHLGEMKLPFNIEALLPFYAYEKGDFGHKNNIYSS